MSRLRWTSGAERPGLNLWWEDDSGALIDFSSGYTYTLKIGPRGGAALLTKTANIVGAVGAGTAPSGTPNIVVTWASGDLALSAGVYHLELKATSSGADRFAETDIVITAALT